MRYPIPPEGARGPQFENHCYRQGIIQERETLLSEYNNNNNITAFSTPHTNVPRRLQNSTECKNVHVKKKKKSRKELVEKVSLNAFFENINGRRLSDIVWKQIP